MPSNLLCPLSGMRECTPLCAWRVDGGCAVNVIAQSFVMLKAYEYGEEQELKGKSGDCPQCSVGVLRRTVYAEPNIVKNGPGYTIVSVCPECGYSSEKHVDELPL